jgi:hypothetical protein
VKFSANRAISRPIAQIAHEFGNDPRFPVTEADFAQGGTLSASGREGILGVRLVWILVPKDDETDVSIDVEFRLPPILRVIEILLPRSLRRRIPNMAEGLLDEFEHGGGFGIGAPAREDPAAAALAAGFAIAGDGSYELRSKRRFWVNNVALTPTGIRVGGWIRPRFVPWGRVKVEYVTASPGRVNIAVNHGRGIRLPRISVLADWPYPSTAGQLKDAVGAWRKTYSNATSPHRVSKFSLKWQTLGGEVLFDGQVEE